MRANGLRAVRHTILGRFRSGNEYLALRECRSRRANACAGSGEPIERLSEGGPVLGLLPGALYSAGIVKIEHGDRLIVYSDGINEATDAER